MDAGEIVTLVIAGYGALLSTVVAVIQRSDKKPKLDVELSAALPLTSRTGEDFMVSLKAMNVGLRSVTLSGYTLVLPDNRQLWPTRPAYAPSFPDELAPGKSCDLMVRAEAVAKVLKDEGYEGTVSLKGRFTDQVGNEYMSEPVDFSIKTWL